MLAVRITLEVLLNQPGYRGMAKSASFPNHPTSLIRQHTHHCGNAWLNNPGLFTSNIAQSRAQNFDVIETDVGDDRDDRLQYIGSIEPSTQTDFNYGYFDLPAREVLEGQGRD